MAWSDMPPYVLWGPVLQTAIIEFIEKAGWKPTETFAFWTHERHEQQTGYLQAFEITQGWLFDTDDDPAAAPTPQPEE